MGNEFTRYSPESIGEMVDGTFHSLFYYYPASSRYDGIKSMSGISVETEGDIVSFSTLEEIIQTHEDLCRQEEFGNKFFFATNISGDVFYFDTKLLSIGDDRVFSRALISEEADAIDVTEFIDSIIKMKPLNI